MSASQSRFGAGALNVRFTRSAGCCTSGAGWVVRIVLARVTPPRPSAAMSPADPITTDRDALSDESAPELADAIDAEVGGMDPADLELQLRVAQGSGRRRPGAVSVIARRGDC